MEKRKREKVKKEEALFYIGFFLFFRVMVDRVLWTCEIPVCALKGYTVMMMMYNHNIIRKSGLITYQTVFFFESR